MANRRVATAWAATMCVATCAAVGLAARPAPIPASGVRPTTTAGAPGASDAPTGESSPRVVTRVGRSSSGYAQVEGLPRFRVGPDAVRAVDRAHRPYVLHSVAPLHDPRRARDAEGVAMYVKDGRQFNHPVLQAQRALALTLSYRNGGGPEYLALAKKHAERMLSYSVRSRGARYFPYPFDFALHGKAEQTLRAPWYSAMAQGQAVSVFVGLYETTGEQRWKDAAEASFASFLNPRAAGVPWTVYVDDQDLLWFEEYPGDPSDRALNGHNYALFGVYDYWRLTGDPRAALLFTGGLEATRQHSRQIRVAGRTSRYCLAHDVHSSSYHDIHIGQFYTLYTLTGSRDLARLGDTFQADAPADYEAGAGYLAAGRHVAVTRDASGRVTASSTVDLPRGQDVSVGSRLWVAGRAGVWLRIDSGPLRGSWVAERPGRAYVLGVRDRVDFTPRRTGVFAAGEHVGYRRGPNGRMAPVATLRLTRASSATVSARQTVDGRVYAMVSTGRLGGLAVPMDGVRLR